MVGALLSWEIVVVATEDDEALLSSLAVAKRRKRCMFRLFVVVVSGE
jgi:hypothetical protein